MIPHRSWLTMLLVVAVFLPEVARAQGTPVNLPVASTPAKTTVLNDLTNRYRFAENYTREDDRTEPGLVASYRVGLVEVVKDSIDTPQGAPRRTEETRQVVFVERPAELGGVGIVGSTTRTYERYRVRPEEPLKTMGARPFEGLSVAFRPRTTDLPQVLSLTEGRRLTEYEYDVAARQVFVPNLAALMANQPVRVGDTWRVSRRAAQAMLGEPGLQGDTLVGRFVELRKEVGGPRLVAVIAVSGRVASLTGETAVNGEALFTFEANPTPKGLTIRPISPPPEGVVNAQGAITELRLARVTSGNLPGPGRLRFQSNREVTLQRQLGRPPNAVGPPRLEAIPAETEANGWLTRIEPSGRFGFRHPQDFLAAPGVVEPNVATLVRARREGADMLQIEFVGKVLAPEALKEKLASKWGQTRLEVIKGTEEWLPEAEWPKMKVHRIEAVVKVVDPRAGSATNSTPTRIHFDGYLVLFGQSASLLAIATTSRDAVAPFRREIEQVLKSIVMDPAVPR